MGANREEPEHRATALLDGRRDAGTASRKNRELAATNQATSAAVATAATAPAATVDENCEMVPDVKQMRMQ